MANLRDSAVTVVSHRLDQQGNTAWTVPFVSDLFVVNAVLFASATSNSAVDRVVWHVATLGIKDSFSQARVTFWIATTGSSSDGYFLNEPVSYTHLTLPT